MRFISIILIALFSAITVLAEENLTAIRDISKVDIDERLLKEAVASRTLSWLTGSSANNDHISVGRIANYFGFVAFRVSSGRSATRSHVAKATLDVLNANQRNQLVALVQDQKIPFQNTQSARYQLNRALEGLLVGEQISEAEFLQLGYNYGAGEAELGRVIAQSMGDVAQTLTAKQMETLKSMRLLYLSGNGHRISEPKIKLKLAKEDKKELVNIAARLFSWTTGSEEFNDFEVVGKPSQHFGFVSLRMESNHGIRRGQVANQVMDMLSPAQHEFLETSAAHNAQTFPDFLSARSKLMRELERAISGAQIDEALVKSLGGEVGEIEASMTWAQAAAMLDVRQSLTKTQSEALLALRYSYALDETPVLPGDPIARGRQLFAQCVLCHDAEGQRNIGPSLSGVFGRRVAAVADFDRFSTALKAFASKGSIWDEQTLDAFLESPRDLVPGTYMGFTGMDNAKDRTALIRYLETR